MEVSDEVTEVLLLMLREENNRVRKIYYHKAYFSLDWEDGIENDALCGFEKSPEDIFIEQEEECFFRLTLERLDEALSHLTPAQERRIRARYLENLKASGELITPKKWQAEAEKLTAQKDLQYQQMKAMREEIKAVEGLRKAAEQLSRIEQTRKQEPVLAKEQPMSDNRKYYYLKLKENFFIDEKMVILESMQDGLFYSNLLLKMYLMSLKRQKLLPTGGADICPPYSQGDICLPEIRY